MEHFVKIVNGIRPITIMTKRSIKDVGEVLDPPLLLYKRHILCAQSFSENGEFESIL